jgi:hypothetical protein
MFSGLAALPLIFLFGALVHPGRIWAVFVDVSPYSSKD